LDDFNVREEGYYRDESTGEMTGLNILHRRGLGERAAEVDELLKIRAGRPAAGLDDKCICAWNGLMIGALAEARYVSEAVRCASVWADFEPGDLPHQIVNGQA